MSLIERTRGREICRRCTVPWAVDGKTICRAGKNYVVRGCTGGDEGYCTVYGEDEQTLWATWMDVEEHFEQEGEQS